MNEDFLIPKTPAKARLLMRLAAINSNVTLSPDIVALASEGVLTEADFAALPMTVCSVGRSALQLILDLGLRAVVPEVHPAYKRPLILCAAKMVGVAPIMVFTPEPEPWLNAAVKVGVDIELPTLAQLADPAWQKDRRDGAVIVENGRLPGVTDARATFGMIGREWYRTIIYGDPDFDPARLQLRHGKPHYYRARHWSDALAITTMIAGLYPSFTFNTSSMKAMISRDLPARGFRNAHPSSVAFLFGLVVPSD